MRGFLQFLITLAVPIVLTMTAVRLLTLPWYPTWQYSREGFPEDPLGLSREERLRLARGTIGFLNVPWRVDTLERLALPDGSPAYGPRELEHMDDVKAVYNALTLLALLLAVAAVIAVWGLIRRQARCAIWGALAQGGALTLAVLLGLGLWMLVGFNAFFTFFHGLFFESGTWVFSYSDTLIRLFPLPFWQDAGLLIAAGVSAVSLLLLVVGTWQHRLCWASAYSSSTPKGASA
ncbi:MAG: TIGR01906 family membrane protein [Anaerolineae bacterium]